jgi:hypothetical protein
MAEVVQEDGQLELTLKLTLEECISLARKKIRSKKGITELQALLTDYRSNVELAGIIFEVVRLVSVYENAKKEESDEIKDTVPLEEYNSLEGVLQKYEASVREHIKVPPSPPRTSSSSRSTARTCRRRTGSWRRITRNC